jgi:hypothetical protein
MPSSNVANARLPVTGARDICVTSRPAPRTASVRSSTLAMATCVQPVTCDPDVMASDASHVRPSALLGIVVNSRLRRKLPSLAPPARGASHFKLSCHDDPHPYVGSLTLPVARHTIARRVFGGKGFRPGPRRVEVWQGSRRVATLNSAA